MSLKYGFDVGMENEALLGSRNLPRGRTRQLPVSYYLLPGSSTQETRGGSCTSMNLLLAQHSLPFRMNY